MPPLGTGLTARNHTKGLDDEMKSVPRVPSALFTDPLHSCIHTTISGGADLYQLRGRGPSHVCRHQVSLFRRSSFFIAHLRCCVLRSPSVLICNMPYILHTSIASCSCKADLPKPLRSLPPPASWSQYSSTQPLCSYTYE